MLAFKQAVGDGPKRARSRCKLAQLVRGEVQQISRKQEFSAAALHKKFNMPYHAGALRYFADHNMQAVEIR